MFRKLHRWTSLPLILFLLLVLGTGVALQIEEIDKLGGPSQAADGASSVAQQAGQISGQAIQDQLSEAIARSRAAEPGFKPTRIELTVRPGQQSTRLAVQPRGGPSVSVDHITGEVRADLEPELPLHVILIRLHTGSMMGAAGVWIILIASLVLLFLAVSGGVLYWQMWSNRRSRGRKSLFWK